MEGGSARIAVIGAGYVGLVTGAGLASLGHRVRLGEVNQSRVEALRAGVTPIFEEGLPELLSEGVGRGLISFHLSNKEAVADASFVFLCLPTPEGEDGRPDLTYVNEVIDELATAVAE
ncbi:MAG: NAD(P)-binding domain-containing protein, partial [Actinobacteria bacterium]|nr:NAD(P)-binding domain-containing protein [Actinomycetota bacterium]